MDLIITQRNQQVSPEGPSNHNMCELLSEVKEIKHSKVP